MFPIILVFIAKTQLFNFLKHGYQNQYSKGRISFFFNKHKCIKKKLGRGTNNAVNKQAL